MTWVPGSCVAVLCAGHGPCVSGKRRQRPMALVQCDAMALRTCCFPTHVCGASGNFVKLPSFAAARCPQHDCDGAGGQGPHLMPGQVRTCLLPAFSVCVVGWGTMRRPARVWLSQCSAHARMVHRVDCNLLPGIEAPLPAPLPAAAC